MINNLYRNNNSRIPNDEVLEYAFDQFIKQCGQDPEVDIFEQFQGERFYLWLLSEIESRRIAPSVRDFCKSMRTYSAKLTAAQRASIANTYERVRQRERIA